MTSDIKNMVANLTTSSEVKEWAHKADFTERDTVATRYFYKRLRAIYGASKYSAAFPSPVDLQVSRREFAHQIGALSKEEIDSAFDFVKIQIELGEDDFMWINIGRILGATRQQGCAAHKPMICLPEPKYPSKEERRLSILKMREEAGL